MRKALDANFNAFMRGELDRRSRYAELVDPLVGVSLACGRDCLTCHKIFAAYSGDHWSSSSRCEARGPALSSSRLSSPMCRTTRVLTLGPPSCPGRESGVPARNPIFFQLYTIRDGKVPKVELFRHRLRGPRSRRAVGVGDVGGERQPRALDPRGVERGDYSSAEWAYPEIGLVIADGPIPGSWTGVAEMAEAWREALSAFEELRGEADEYRALDEERVLVLMHFSGRGKTSGMEVGVRRGRL